jgi:hypothetical protein
MQLVVLGQPRNDPAPMEEWPSPQGGLAWDPGRSARGPGEKKTRFGSKWSGTQYPMVDYKFDSYLH